MLSENNAIAKIKVHKARIGDVGVCHDMRVRDK